MKGKYFFGWTNFKHVAKQLYLTFTEQRSELSSKKIERALFIITGITAWCVWFSWHYRVLVVSEMILATGTLFTYAGYTMRQSQKEKQLNKTDEQRTTPEV